jgi:ABC-type nickel/cobalt efflux system permease component RcnA
MNSFFNDNKAYIFILALVILVACYYLVDYQIKSTLRHELKSMHHKKQKKMKLHKIKQQRMAQMMESQKNREQHELDSYIDPAEEQQYENEQRNREHLHHDNSRLPKDDILMRDLTDGAR